MAERLGEALLELGTIDKGYAAGVDRAEKRAMAFGQRLDQVGRQARNIGAVLSVALTAPLALFGRQAVQAATDAGELQSAFDFSFGSMAKDMNEWARTTGDALGRSTQALQQQAFTFNQLFKAAAPTGKQAADLSRQFTLLAQDLSSFFNVTEDDALQKLRAGLVGEAEPLRTFGVFLSEAALKAKALELGLGGASGKLSEQEKILARAAIIMEQTSDAQGDLARTAQSASNQQRALGAAFSEISVAVGNVLLPVITPLVGVLTDIVNGFAGLSPETQKWAVLAGGLAAAIGPLLAILGTMAIAIGAISAPVLLVIGGVAALTAGLVYFRDETANVLAAIPGFGPVLAALVRNWEAVTAAITQAIAALRGFFSASAQEKLAGVRQGIETTRENLEAQQRRIFEPGAGPQQRAHATEQFQGFYSKLEQLRAHERRLEAEMREASAPAELPAVSVPAVSVPSTPAPEIPDLGGGGGKGGRKGAAKTEASEFARAMEAAADAIARVKMESSELGLTEAQVARLRLETELMAAAEEEFGTVSAEAARQIAAMGEQIEIETLIKQANREETERLADAEEDRLRRAASAAGEITGVLKDALKGGLDGATSFAESMLSIMTRLRDRLIDAAFRPIENALTNLFTGGGKSGGGGLFGKLLGGIGSLLGGAIGGGATGGKAGGTLLKGFAGGGWAEGWAMVGELGPEPVYLGQGGRVMSNADMRGAMAGQGQQPAVNVQVITRDPDTQVRVRPSAATTARDMRRAFGMGGAYG